MSDVMRDVMFDVTRNNYSKEHTEKYQNMPVGLSVNKQANQKVLELTRTRE